jgi:SAM-dependent methyltransferase
MFLMRTTMKSVVFSTSYRCATTTNALTRRAATRDASFTRSSSSSSSSSSSQRDHRTRGKEISEGRHEYKLKTSQELKQLFLDAIRGQNKDEITIVKLTGTGKAPKEKKPEHKKTELRPVLIKNEVKVQLIQFTETQSFTKNFRSEREVEEIIEDVVANGGYGNWRVEMRDETTYDIRVTKSGDAFVSKSKNSKSSSENKSISNSADKSKNATTKGLINTTRKNASFLANDREKKRLMRADDPFLVQVGVSTTDGKIKAAKRDKYKQVEEFLHHLEASLSAASEENNATSTKPLSIVDLGCGNAYLTFATYSFLKNTKKIDANVVGVDVKKQSKEHNESVAKELGWERDVSFVQGTIEKAEIPGAENVDVCIALHACDTATDQSLVRAVRWETKLILASPCCHHDLHVRIRKNGLSSSVLLSSIARHGILYERTIDNVTDAWRALVLRILGYKVDVVEFIGGEHTARNTLIRARYTGAKATKELWDEHDALVASFGCESYLTEALKEELESRRIPVT